MKITKITDRSISPNTDGDWVVFAQVLVGNCYQYGALIYQTFEEARQAKEGDNIDTEKVKFSRRVNGVML